ncbi:MAG TPA: ribonuclease III [Clostridiales bacterium]|nr:ribonuclease III [Clostridiales bacterium]
MIDYFQLDMNPGQLGQISSLGLAHVGDGVYELMVRSWLCLKGKATNKGLHRAAVRYVAAPAQARMAERLRPVLTEEEVAVFRRGRNSHTGGIPRGASVAEYHTATGLEALFGWLYLQGRTQRLNELFTIMMEE